LSKWYVHYEEAERVKLTGEIHRRIVTRDSKHTNFVEVKAIIIWDNWE
jgi:Clathrin adaptor complex, small subunit